MELKTDDILSIDLSSSELSLDNMQDVQELNVELQGGDDIQVEMEQEQSLEVKMVEGVPVGIDDYEVLRNKPKVNGVELIGDKSNEDLNMHSITNMELARILT